MSIELNDVSFSYGAHVVLDGVSFDLPDNGMVGLVGPNGVGKTTLLKVLGGILRCDNESLEVVRKQMRVVYLDDGFLVLDHLTTRETIDLVWAQFSQTPFQWSEYEHLLPDMMRDTPVNKLSLGQKRRLLLLIAIVTPCRVLLLDEPFNGLDPIAVEDFCAVFQKKAREAYVVYATHDLDRLSTIATQCILMSPGSPVRVIGKPDFGTITQVLAGDGNR